MVTNDELRADNERLLRWKAEATEVILGLQDLGRALGIGLGERITGSSAAEFAKSLSARTEAAEAKLARVEALVRRTELLDGNPMDSWVGTRDLLAALNGPPELEYPDLAYAVQKGGPNIDGPTVLTDEPTGDAMRWTSCLPTLGDSCGNCHRCTG